MSHMSFQFEKDSISHTTVKCESTTVPLKSLLLIIAHYCNQTISQITEDISSSNMPQTCLHFSAIFSTPADHHTSYHQFSHKPTLIPKWCVHGIWE